MSEQIQPWPVVRRGDHDHPVRTLQHLLNAGPASLVVDGDFGPKTETAVREFQTAIHADVPSMAIDGIAGPMTWQALVSGMLSF